MKRYALVVTGSGCGTKAVARFLPDNYRVIGESYEGTVIEGEDKAGWTLDDYVLPRLASGLLIGREIDLSHPAMKMIERTRARGIPYGTDAASEQAPTPRSSFGVLRVQERSYAGNLVLAAGRTSPDGWSKTEHIVLTPQEWDSLRAEVDALMSREEL